MLITYSKWGQIVTRFIYVCKYISFLKLACRVFISFRSQRNILTWITQPLCIDFIALVWFDWQFITKWTIKIHLTTKVLLSRGQDTKVNNIVEIDLNNFWMKYLFCFEEDWQTMSISLRCYRISTACSSCVRQTIICSHSWPLFYFFSECTDFQLRGHMVHHVTS